MPDATVVALLVFFRSSGAAVVMRQWTEGESSQHHECLLVAALHILSTPTNIHDFMSFAAMQIFAQAIAT